MASEPLFPEPDVDPTPTRARFDVRSEQTGRVVIADVPEPVAAAEAERLNRESHRQIGDVPIDGRRVLHAGEQGGTGPTRYTVVETSTTDETAQAAALEHEAEQTRARIADAGEAERARLTAAAEHLDEQAAQLTDQAERREQTNQAALAGLDA